MSAPPGLSRPSELLGIRLPTRRRRVEKDECQRIAGLRHRFAALTRHFASHAAGIFRNHFAEAVALDRHLLSDLDPLVQLDQMLDQSALELCAIASVTGIESPTMKRTEKAKVRSM